MIATRRLVLRPWRREDKPAFHDIVNTPAMMAHFGGVRDRAAIDALIDQQIAAQERDGFSMWAVETGADGALAGICGLRRSAAYDGTSVGGMLEIGWRIAERLWGSGVAREAARASLDWGWANTADRCILAWTNAANARSRGLMRALGMARRPELDFLHPRYATPDPLGEMLVHGIDRPVAA